MMPRIRLVFHNGCYLSSAAIIYIERSPTIQLKIDISFISEWAWVIDKLSRSFSWSRLTWFMAWKIRDRLLQPALRHRLFDYKCTEADSCYISTTLKESSQGENANANCSLDLSVLQPCTHI